jgi:phosphoglycerol transferase MdoB-like AlkP superfamily enzyme
MPPLTPSSTIAPALTSNWKGRWALTGIVVIGFLVLNALVRVGLAVFNGFATASWDVFTSGRLVPAVLVGAMFDAVAVSFVAAGWGTLMLLWPMRASHWLKGFALPLLMVLCAVATLVAASEFTFWNEFASRFNFIAVDYLVYTNEVIGNIRESYNMPLLLTAVAAVALAMLALLARFMKPHWRVTTPPHRRWLGLAVLWVLPVAGVLVTHARFKEFSEDAQANELAGNGYYDFFHAFWHNELDYDRFYKTMPQAQAVQVLRHELLGHQPPFVQLSQRSIERRVEHAGAVHKPLNVVLITVESLSAEFLQAFGNRDGLTPQLDRLAEQGLLFTQVYATGTRTVRGLEAVTLSVPPTPGHAIVKRPHNDNLHTLGEVFKGQGYEPMYLYGGYGYFDNMNAFFGGNGYTVIDRTAIDAKDIHFENIWGVADEDLFTLTLRELDARHARQQKFFAHVMTTSNHRPFTYPEGRIDIPSRTSRSGGVKYSDWALGDFIQRAQAKPWFDNTVFVILGDHTHKGRGKQELPPANYHIPLLVYAPAHIKAGRVDTLASQIDVGPTLLGLLNAPYTSHFFGHDILREGQTHPRALLANYQTVGYYEQGRVVELKPNARVRVVMADTGKPAPDDALSRYLIDEAVSYYQVASRSYRDGLMRASTK